MGREEGRKEGGEDGKGGRGRKEGGKMDKGGGGKKEGEEENFIHWFQRKTLWQLKTSTNVDTCTCMNNQ